MKKLLISLMIMCAAILPVSALESTDVNGTVTGEILVNGEVVDNSRAEFSDVLSEIEDEAMREVITELNKGTALVEVLADAEIKLPESVELTKEDITLLTVLQDLKAYDADNNVIEGPVTVSWEVPNLKEDVGEVYVLHYSTVRNVWEVLSPDAVDFASKTITCSFEDLSPVAVVYKSTQATTEPTVAPTTEPTETQVAAESTEEVSSSNNASLYLGLGVVAIVVVAGIVFFTKKK